MTDFLFFVGYPRPSLRATLLKVVAIQRNRMLQVVIASEKRSNPPCFIYLPYLIIILPKTIIFLPFFVWILPNGDSLPKKHSFLTQKTMFFCRKNYVFSLLKRPLAETKSRTAESFPFLAKLFPLLVVFFFLGQPSLSVLTRHKARQSTKHKAEYIASPYGSQ